MAPTISMHFAMFFLLFVAIIHGCSGAIGVNTVLDDLCETLGRYEVTLEDCRSALCYDPSLPCSAAYNASALATLATQLTVANATGTTKSIKEALSSFVAVHNSTAEDEEIELAMLSCLDLYRGIMPALQWATRSVAVGQYHGVREVMNATWYISYGCDGLVESAGILPSLVLPKENVGFGIMTHVTYAIVASMSRD